MTVAGTTSDGSTLSKTSVSDANGAWAVELPDGSYTATPQGEGWDPPSRSETLSGDVSGVNFVKCVASEANGSSLRLGQIAAAAHCTATSVKCTSSKFPDPSDCFVTVRDVSAQPAGAPEGYVEVASSGSPTFSGAGNGNCGQLAPLATGSAKATCSFSILSPPGKQHVVVYYNPKSTVWRSSIGDASFTVAPSPTISTKQQLHDWLTTDAAIQSDVGTVMLDAATALGGAGTGVSLTTVGAKAAVPTAVVFGSMGFVGLVQKYPLSYVESELAGYFKDPPDDHYRVLPKPRPSLTIPQRYRHVFDRRDANGVYRAAVHLRALTTVEATAVNRAMTAAKAGATKWRDLQAQGAITFLRQMAADTRTMIADQIRLSHAVARTPGGNDRLRFKSTRFRREFGQLTFAQLLAYPPEIARLRHLASLFLTASQNPALHAFPKIPSLFP